MHPKDLEIELRTALGDGSFVGLTLSAPLTPDESARVRVRPVRLKNGLKFQVSSRTGNQERHENLSGEELATFVGDALGRTHRDLTLQLAQQDVHVVARPGAKLTVRRQGVARGEPAAVKHDFAKKYLLEPGQPVPFLVELGIMTADGQVREAKQKKFRQINRYLEFVRDIESDLPPAGTLRIVDYGSGKSYLTFALHHYFSVLRGREVELVGIDERADVIATCTAVATRLGWRGLTFRASKIADLKSDAPIDLAVSLHACDTATDDALAAALSWRARVIFAVPCCHKQIAPQLRPASLSLFLDHGLARERLGALATDTLRAAFLEACGYTTQLVEFIETEHTPKNVLLRAVRAAPSATRLAERAARYARFKEELGVTTFQLEDAAPGDFGSVYSTSDRA